MARNSIDDLLTSFRKIRNQEEVGSNSKEEIKVTARNNSSKKQSKYKIFLNKYEELEDWVDNFKSQDLMYFFKVKSIESEHKYVIANMKRDLGIFKKLLIEGYTPREVCTIIEFLFSDEQTFLDKRNLQPTILVSSWCNTLFKYSQEWLEDEYIPHEKRIKNKITKKFKPVQTREWEEDEKEVTRDNHVKIGEWE